MQVKVFTIFPAALWEVDRHTALTLMVTTLQDRYREIAAGPQVDPALRAAALADLSQQIATLRQLVDQECPRQKIDPTF